MRLVGLHYMYVPRGRGPAMLEATSMGILGSEENLRNNPCGLGGILLDICSG